jgi:MoxR-like ATPase
MAVSTPRMRRKSPPAAVASDTPAPAIAPTPAPRSLLRPLGIVGYDALEPALLAALATEEPLLLVSDHGAAKTLLLLRLANALGLALRHYNASILQFDDLIGFPIPDSAGAIRYAAPPGAIWDAEVAFFDEIGRCRPDVANKLFPLIHEKRIQGVAIERLRYRWAATNPPPDAQESDDDGRYDGVEALDPALADRFAFIVSLPRFADLSDADRRLIISGVGDAPTAGAATAVRELVHATQALIPTVRATSGDALATYVDVLIAKLGAARIGIGGRRAAMLLRNVVAVRAAHLALGLASDERACRAAVLSSIPDVVRTRVSRATLLAAHEAAWRETSMSDDDPRRTLLSVRDPLRRALLAISLPGVSSVIRGEALCSALADMPTADATMLAWTVLPALLSMSLVPATAVETVASLVSSIAYGGAEVRGFGPHRDWAIDVRRRLSHTALPANDLEFMHGVIAKFCTPAQQLTGVALPNAEDIIVRLVQVREACLASLATHVRAA